MDVSSPVAIGLVLLIVGAGLGLANALRDRGAPDGVTRWVASVAGGLAYVVAIAWLDPITAIAVSALCALVLALLRAKGATFLRGLRASAAEQSRAELGYPAAATAALALGWATHHGPWLSFAAIAFMAWGDASAGLVRRLLPPGRSQSVAASAAMLCVCALTAALFYRSLAGFAAAVLASVAEAVWPFARSRISDNWAVVASGLGVMIFLGGN